MKDRWATQRLHEYIQKGFAAGGIQKSARPRSSLSDGQIAIKQVRLNS